MVWGEFSPFKSNLMKCIRKNMLQKAVYNIKLYQKTIVRDSTKWEYVYIILTVVSHELSTILSIL